MEKLSINNATIELTRRCNMQCRHCLRGPAQNVDISTEYLESFFSKVSYISGLCLTGGEPSLVPEKIREVIRIAKKYDVDIGSFDLTVNGKRVSDDFLVSMIELYNYCSDNETSMLMLSTDYYHERITEENLNKLGVFKFFQKRMPYNDKTELINDGYAEINGIGRREDKIYGYEMEIDDNHISEGNVYLNCKGNIIPTCDMGYERQDEPENIVCHVNDMSLEKFSDFNLKLELETVDN